MKKRLGLSFCLFISLAGCQSSFRENLDEKQADDIVVLLEQQGIKADKVRAKDGSWSVDVARNEQLTAGQIMQAYDRPRTAHPSLGDIFPGGSLLPSEAENRIRYEYALAQELSTTIEKIDGVLSARVHVAIPEKDPKRVTPAQPSASAVIRYRSDQRLDLLKPQLKALIADSVVDGSPDNVELLMVPIYPVAQAEALQEVQTHAGLRYRASEWLRVALFTGLPWLVAFLLLLAFLRGMSKGDGGSWRSLWTASREWFRQHRGGNGATSAGDAGRGPSYVTKSLAGLAARRPKPAEKKE